MARGKENCARNFRGYLADFAAFSRKRRRRCARTRWRCALGLAPGLFLQGLRFARDDHCTNPLICLSFCKLIE
ncbi:MAG: hypothetical protein DBX55_02285 [Verrucomicrobia bacterium]|nr:MAG: hypothetical protein DBX55_02285 [Verrucomicrobiota bacterium]